MRYLRMLSNSAFAGLLAAVYLAVLVLYLNPAVPVRSDTVLPIFTMMAATYGAHIAVASYLVYVIRQIALSEPSSPGWISLRLMTWSAAALSGTAAVITWMHAAGLRNTLIPSALPLLTRVAVVFAGAATAFLLLGVAQGFAKERRRASVAILFTVATTASIVVPFAVRGPAVPAMIGSAHVAPVGQSLSGGARILLLCLDGASLDFISPAVAAGRLPNFGRVLERGASLHLATTRPTQVEPAWTSVMTGKWPARHGIRGHARYRSAMGGLALDLLPDYLYSQGLVRFGFFREEPYTASDLRVQTLWRVLARQGLAAGLIGLPLTDTAGLQPGFVVSDRVVRGGRGEPMPVIYPPDVEALARAVVDDDDPASAPVSNIGAELIRDEAATALAADRLHHRLAARLGTARPVRLLAVRYSGIDVLGHDYLRFAQADAVGNVTDEERRRNGRVLDEYYGYIDSIVGDMLSSMRNDDLLFIVSAFGMEPLTLQKRMLERVAGDSRFSATHERAPDGFAIAYGDAVPPGRLTRGAVVDVTPTLLYFLGLSIGRDMDGFARTDMFTVEFNAGRTITFIPTYEMP